jgi:hypothetical protein
MKTYNVYTGEYPFTDWIGYVTADTPEEALDSAIKTLGGAFPHPVIGEEENFNAAH